jgi:ABC-type oligopeptide transport system ATPase subunit
VENDRSRTYSIFNVPRGKILGIVGESGCGKSTLVKTIIGLEKSTAGKARFGVCLDIRCHR